MLDGQPVGYALATEDHFGAARATVLETLVVLPDPRGHGVGTLLMRAVDESARPRSRDLTP